MNIPSQAGGFPLPPETGAGSTEMGPMEAWMQSNLLPIYRDASPSDGIGGDYLVAVNLAEYTAFAREQDAIHAGFVRAQGVIRAELVRMLNRAARSFHNCHEYDAGDFETCATTLCIAARAALGRAR